MQLNTNTKPKHTHFLAKQIKKNVYNERRTKRKLTTKKILFFFKRRKIFFLYFISSIFRKIGKRNYAQLRFTLNKICKERKRNKKKILTHTQTLANENKNEQHNHQYIA